MKKLITIVKYLFFPFLMSQAAGSTDINAIIGNQAVTAKVENGNMLWVGTANGIWVINMRNQKAQHLTTENSVLPANDILGMVEVNGNIYAATEKGIFRYDGYAYLVINAENSNLPESGITAMAADRNGNLWIGTLNGLVLLDNYKCKYFNNRNSALTGNRVAKLRSDDNGNILVLLANQDVIGISEKGMSVILSGGSNTPMVASK